MKELRKLLRLAARALKELRFLAFVARIDKRTWRRHEELLSWAENRRDDGDGGAGPVVRRGAELRAAALASFKGKLRGVTGLRVLLHVPPKETSPGGFSLFSNLADSLEYIGVPARKLHWGDDFGRALDEFSPTHFLSSDHRMYLDRIDWDRAAAYRKGRQFAVGLTASVDLQGDITLADRLEWGRAHGVSFYYGFRTGEYFGERPEYAPYFGRGGKIISVEFGANPLLYYPVQAREKDLDYIFLASSNIDKHARYFEWLPEIVFRTPGLIDGPGWYRIGRCAPREIHRHLYARAKVGLNLHIDDSLRWASELNERTYILAACGLPQLIDNPKLLFRRFSREAVFCAETPAEYAWLYRGILADPKAAEQRALLALEEVYARHTTFHRAEKLAAELAALS